MITANLELNRQTQLRFQHQEMYQQQVKGAVRQEENLKRDWKTGQSINRKIGRASCRERVYAPV